MHHHFLYVTGLCLGISFAAEAAGLPANPWLQNTTGNIVQTNNNQAVNPNASAAKAAEITEKIGEQAENYGIMLQQATDEAVIKAKTANQTQDIEDIPSWQDIMEQIMPEKQENPKEDASPQPQKNSTSSFDPAGMVQVSKAISDAQEQYNRAKATTGAYYNQAKNKLKQLEHEAENSVNEVQNMLKK